MEQILIRMYIFVNDNVFFEAFYGFYIAETLFTNFWSRKPLLKQNKEKIWDRDVHYCLIMSGLGSKPLVEHTK